MQRRRAIAAALFALAACGLVQAQEYPARPVKVIVPFPAGGSADILARLIAQGLGDKLGQQFVVENRAGAAGNLGTDAVAKAAPDGYTLGLSTSGPLANNKFLYKSMPYDPEKAFAPVVLVGEIPLVIVAHPGVPAKNLKEFVELARANPGRNSVGHPGNGTIGHLALELMKANTKADLLAVPYKGDTPAMTDLLGGTIQAISAPVSAFIPNIQAGKLTALAVTSKARFQGLPNVATALEQGIDLEASVWFAMVAPAGTPKTIVDRINAEANRIINSTEGRAKLAQFGAIAIAGAPERLAAQIATDSAKWKRVIESAKISLD
jgi:tripartite-type tricarboxylate transporter receptor subunit TctC